MKKPQKNAAPKRGSLGQVLTQSQEIKKTITQAASELTSVNEVLKQGEAAHLPPPTIQAARTQNEAVENKVTQAATDLTQVNADLAQEVAERGGIETELADTKTELAAARADLSAAQKIALQDPLTGLPNRVLFEQSLAQGLAQAQRHGRGLAVLFIDLDQFKSINDTYGHEVGDQVLCLVAARLQATLRAEDTVSRWGGDEFVCLLLEVKQIADVMHLAEKLVARLAEACELNGVGLSIQASIGIAFYPTDGTTAEHLFKNADTAMYQAKGSAQRVVRFHEAPNATG